MNSTRQQTPDKDRRRFLKQTDVIAGGIATAAMLPSAMAGTEQTMAKTIQHPPSD